jgi:hypothetical protein
MSSKASRPMMNANTPAAYAGLFSARSVCHQGDQRLMVTRSIHLSSICDFVDPVLRFLKRGHLCV